VRIIAIETSGRVGSVAALVGKESGAQVVREIVLSEDQRTAQRLAPALSELLGDVGWLPPAVELVAVAVGPGSFTGLRIGVTAAKLFAYAVGAEVVGANTLAVLAAQSPVCVAPLWTVVDAQRRELFAARWEPTDRSGVSHDCDVSILGEDAWTAKLQAGEQATGLVLKRLASRLPSDVTAVEASLWQPMASTVGRVGWQAFVGGHRDDVRKLSPRYYRPSAAEEKRS
jgi:tRNA threonylcarbamoyladenosine biosynthesis protein TsaB